MRRYASANTSSQATAARAEAEGLAVEGFSAARLRAAQAWQPSAGRPRNSEQVNILNLPLPDFSVAGAAARPELYLVSKQRVATVAQLHTTR